MLRGVCCWGSPRVPPRTRSIACRTVAVLTWAALTYGGADLSEAILVSLYNNAERCGLTGADLTEANLRGVERGAELVDADLTGADRTGCLL